MVARNGEHAELARAGIEVVQPYGPDNPPRSARDEDLSGGNEIGQLLRSRTGHVIAPDAGLRDRVDVVDERCEMLESESPSALRAGSSDSMTRSFEAMPPPSGEAGCDVHLIVLRCVIARRAHAPKCRLFARRRSRSWVRCAVCGTTVAAAVLLIALPIAFNGAFAALAATFDYPDVLRRPTGEVLERFAQGGSRLVLLWWAFAMTAILLAPLRGSRLGSSRRRRPDPALPRGDGRRARRGRAVPRAHPLAVPRALPRSRDERHPTRPRRAGRRSTWSSSRSTASWASRSGEHLGFLLTGTWSVLVGRRDHAGHCRARMARRRRDRRRCRARAVLARVRRTVRALGLEDWRLD